MCRHLKIADGKWASKKITCQTETWQVIYGGLGFFIGGKLSGLLDKLLFVGVEVVSEFALELGNTQ